MTAEEVRAELRRCHQLPNGRAKAQRLESLAGQARETGDHHVEAEVLISLSNAYEYSSERERIPLPVGRVLQLLDRFPAEVGDLSHTIHWHLKWLTGALIDNPDVPLATIDRWLDECESRYRQRGYSPRPVHAHRSRLARSLGDDVTAAAQLAAAISATRDQMSDCAACEQNGFGEARAAAGDDAGALDAVGAGARRLQAVHGGAAPHPGQGAAPAAAGRPGRRCPVRLPARLRDGPAEHQPDAVGRTSHRVLRADRQRAARAGNPLRALALAGRYHGRRRDQAQLHRRRAGAARPP